MFKKYKNKYLAVFLILILFCSSIISMISVTGISTLNNKTPSVLDEYFLPDPDFIEMPLECAMSRRMSIRNFTEDIVSIPELSTILWTAYGYREDHTRTVSGINNTHAIHIYVFDDDGVYKYDPLNHSLILFKIGDFRSDIDQYEAPIQLGLVWNKSLNPDENYSSAEIGQIGQNIQFATVALNLGTVVTAERPSPLDDIGLPENEFGKIIMPLGHLEYPYNFEYKPRWISLLPIIKQSENTLSDVINEREESDSFEGRLTRKEKSQLLWSSYGYSYLQDKSNQAGNPLKRHRTVPSAHGYYPFRVYAVTKYAVWRYIPGLLDYDRFGLPIVSYLLPVNIGDKRQIIADASRQIIKDAPLLIIPVLDIEKTNQWDDLSSESIRWVWSYEAGAIAHNVMLQANTLGLESNIIPPTDLDAILTALRLDENYQPMFIVPIGK